MKSHTPIFLTIAVALAAICCSTDSAAQQHYKLRQSTSMMGMKQESVIYVKPMRKRTENSGYMGQENNVVTIEQCDKQRMVTLNTKKKLYFLEPFANDNEEVIDEDAKPVTKPKTTPVTTKKEESFITTIISQIRVNARKCMVLRPVISGPPRK